jgi:plastocyanin
MQTLKTPFYTNRPMSQRIVPYVLLAAAVVMAACGGEKKTTPSESPSTAAPAAAVASGPLTPDPGGKIITVELISDAAGNYFKPSEITAKRGDVVRYTLKVGVHNVHFLADSNAGRTGYPQAPSDFLQLPGQTYDVAVHMAAGTYYFQCDPHVALGMKGHLIVQ